MKKITKIIKMFSAALLLASTSVYAENGKSGLEILKKSYDYQGSLDKYAVAAKVTFDIKEDGKTFELSHTARAKIDRPDKMRVDSKGETIERSIYLSNGIYTMIDYIDNDEMFYTQIKTPKTIDDMLDHLIDEFGIVLPVATLLHSDMSDYIHPKKVYNFGKKRVQGADCDYIAFRHNGKEVHLWIEDSATPLLRQAYIKAGDAEIKFATRWDLKPGFPDSVFEFKAPKGASKVSIEKSK